MADIAQIDIGTSAFLTHTAQDIDDTIEIVKRHTAQLAFLNDPQMHNGIFQERDITESVGVDELCNRAQSGNFGDLALGNYIKVNITTTLPDGSEVNEDVELMIGGFNTHLNVGNTPLTQPHILMLPRRAGFKNTVKMNEAATTDGGYLNSYMHKTVLPCYAKSLKTALKNHVITHHELLSNKMTATTPSMGGAGLTGASTGWAWTDVDLCLMTEVEVFGTTVYSSSGYDVGSGYEKLPVFNFINPVQYQRGTFWLRAVTSATNFAFCGDYGSPAGSSASNALYVRPYFLLG